MVVTLEWEIVGVSAKKWAKITMFQGSSALTLDAKGRVSIPTRHRDALMERAEGRLTLTRHPDGCLLVYPRPDWEAKREQIAAFPMQARALQRLLLGNAQDVELDGSGRILVAPELRTAAGMERDVMLLGMGSHFELWDAAALARQEAAALAQGMPEALNQFSF
jgi:MraZ protein